MTSESSSYVDFLLAEMRCAVLRARLLENEITALGVGLRGGLVSQDIAVEHLRDCGALWLMGPAITSPSSH